MKRFTKAAATKTAAPKANPKKFGDRPFFALILGFVIGAVLLVFGLLDANDALYRPHWNPTIGEVVATEPVGPNSDPNATRIWVRYTTAAGRELTMPREFNLTAHPQFNVGNLVTVLYNEPNPLQHFIRTPNPAQDAMGVAAIFGGGAIIAGSIVLEARKQLKTRAGETAAVVVAA